MSGLNEERRGMVGRSGLVGAFDFDRLDRSGYGFSLALVPAEKKNEDQPAVPHDRERDLIDGPRDWAVRPPTGAQGAACIP